MSLNSCLKNVLTVGSLRCQRKNFFKAKKLQMSLVITGNSTSYCELFWESFLHLVTYKLIVVAAVLFLSISLSQLHSLLVFALCSSNCYRKSIQCIMQDGILCVMLIEQSTLLKLTISVSTPIVLVTWWTQFFKMFTGQCIPIITLFFTFKFTNSVFLCLLRQNPLNIVWQLSSINSVNLTNASFLDSKKKLSTCIDHFTTCIQKLNWFWT